MKIPGFQFVVVLAAVVGLMLLVWWGRVISARRITRWCQQEGYTLLDWRGAWFYEGPSAWFRSENQSAYRIRIEDRQGFIREGYLVFGSRWLGWPLSRKVRVEWD